MMAPIIRTTPDNQIPRRVNIIRSHLQAESIQSDLSFDVQSDITVETFSDNVVVATTPGSIDLRPKVNQDAVSFNQSSDRKKSAALCLCDGHGEFGERVSRLVSSTVAKSCLVTSKDKSNIAEAQVVLARSVQELVRSEVGGIADYAGCTCVWAYETTVDNEDALVVCNVGDSRCLVVNDGWEIVFETKDHKPDEPSEQRRIEEAGGRVTKRSGGVARVAGLALSRAFGDFAASKSGVIADPDVTVIPRSDARRKLSFVFVASDGVFDVFDSKQVVEFLKAKRAEGKSLEETLAMLASESVKRWLAEYSGEYCDDITCALWIL